MNASQILFFTVENLNLILYIRPTIIRMDSDKFCFTANSLVRVSAEEEAALNKRDGIVPRDDVKAAWANARFKYALEYGTHFNQSAASEEYDRLHAQGKI